MTSRSTDDLPRRILQRLADGRATTLQEAILGEHKPYQTSLNNFVRRRERMGYKSTYEMLASYVSEGIVVVDKRLEEWAK